MILGVHWQQAPKQWNLAHMDHPVTMWHLLEENNPRTTHWPVLVTAPLLQFKLMDCVQLATLPPVLSLAVHSHRLCSLLDAGVLDLATARAVNSTTPPMEFRTKEAEQQARVGCILHCSHARVTGVHTRTNEKKTRTSSRRTRGSQQQGFTSSSTARV